MRRSVNRLLGLFLAAAMALQSPMLALAAEEPSAAETELSGEIGSISEGQDSAGDGDIISDDTSEKSGSESEDENGTEDNNTADGENINNEGSSGEDNSSDVAETTGEESENPDEAAAGDITSEEAPRETDTAADALKDAAKNTAAEDIRDYDGFIAGLQILEGYAEAYASENGGDAVEYTLNYVRTGVDKYATGLWNELAGSEITEFKEYVAQQDAANGTNASAMKDLGMFTAPNGQDCELNHIFGVMDITYHNRNASNPKDSADLGGWAGDLVDLLYQVQQGGVSGDDLEEMIAVIRSDYLGKYISAGSFGQEDIYADLDAYNIIYTVMNDGVDLYSAFSGYFTSGLSDPARAQSFVSRRFPSVQSRTRLRRDMFSTYTGNFGISMLESSRGLDSGYDLQRKASVYAFADYLADLIDLPETADNDETEDDDPDHAVSMETFLEELRTLESYAEEYTSGNSDYATWLVLNYAVLSNQYYDVADKESLVGTLDENFAAYVESRNEANGTSTSCFRNYGLSMTPATNEQFNLAEMIGAIAIVAKDSDNQDLGIWAMDVADLMNAAAGVSGETVEEKSRNIRKDYLGVEGETGFGILEIRAKLDAVGVGINLMQGMKLSDAITSYYTDDVNIYSRAKLFISTRFPNIEDKASLRNAITSVYSSSGASAYEEEPDDTLRTAACYAWADYLANLAFSAVIDPDEQGQEEDLPTNDYYSVFSSTNSTLAPGIRQTIRYALTADDKQIVYYIATVDVGRDDVEIYANYNNNQGTSWGMQAVTDQVAAWQSNHPDGGTPVVSTNADFFNMSTGRPSGALVMEGKEYTGIGNENFFGILNDGTPIIGGSTEWYANRDQIKEAVGGGAYLVKDGKIYITSTTNYYNSRASRTCVGITEDGQVVMMVLDGRQAPFSAGGSSIEIAQIMLEAGCVTAINLDGGGSTTFAAKQEGENEISIVNRPSDGFERRVSSSLLVVSKAGESSEFDHVSLSADYTYLTEGASLQIESVGVSASGGAADIPEGAQWHVSNPDIGSVDENGVFTAEGIGTALVELQVDEMTVGSLKLHVVNPDGLSFETDDITAVYGTPMPLPVIATYLGNPVLLTSDTEAVNFTLARPAAGTISGLIYTPADENCGVRSTEVTASLDINPGVKAKSTIYLYKSGESYFDFNDATVGDRSLAWKREVSNSTTDDEQVYLISDPDEEMEISYVFALDMNELAVPENVAQALPEVAQFIGGGMIEGELTAWNMLLLLAERISPSTTVNVTIKLDPNLEVNLDNIVLNCEYFELTDIEKDEETNTYTLVCNWIKVNGPIDAGTANPLCIVSGIKAKAKDNAAWDENSQLAVSNTGSIKYVARLRSSQAYAIAGSELGRQYGLSQYDNTANLVNDKGAEFSSTHADFEDSFVLDKSAFEGWVTEEDGSSFYYIKNKKVTGLQYLPENDGTPEGGSNNLYYTFSDDGVCKGVYTGLVPAEGGNYYCAVAGEQKTGWREFDGKNYYFDHTTHLAVDGIQTLSGKTYTFVDYVLTIGAWVEEEDGTHYYWAGRLMQNQWVQVGEDYYYLFPYGPRAEGISRTRDLTYSYWGTFIFTDEGVFLKDQNGFYETGDGTYWTKDGEILTYPGLIEYEGEYYYFKSNNKLVTGCDYYVSKTNGLLKAGTYHFDDKGVLQLYNGIVDIDGVLYYYVDGVKTYAGLIEIDGDYYYVRSNCQLAVDCSYYVSRNNDLKPVGTYKFDKDGKMIVDEGGGSGGDEPDPGTFTGIKADDSGVLHYYIEDVLQKNNGLILLGGNYYYVNGSGVVVSGRDYGITKTNNLSYTKADGTQVAFQSGKNYTFDANGVLLMFDGLVDIDGETYYYADAVKTYAGLIKIGDDYYYITSSCKPVKGRSYYVSKTNDLKPAATYEFAADGRMITDEGGGDEPDPTTFTGIKADDSGVLHYYIEDVMQKNSGLILLDGKYYYVNGSGVVISGRDYGITKTNNLSYTKADGTKAAFRSGKNYTFDADGVLKICDGLVDIDGETYYYVDSVKTYAGLIEVDGAYYYISSSCKPVKGRSYYVSKTNDLKPAGTYTFGDDGKMIE